MKKLLLVAHLDWNGERNLCLRGPALSGSFTMVAKVSSSVAQAAGQEMHLMVSFGVVAVKETTVHGSDHKIIRLWFLERGNYLSIEHECLRAVNEREN